MHSSTRAKQSYFCCFHLSLPQQAPVAVISQQSGLSLGVWLERKKASNLRQRHGSAHNFPFPCNCLGAAWGTTCNHSSTRLCEWRPFSYLFLQGASRNLPRQCFHSNDFSHLCKRRLNSRMLVRSCSYLPSRCLLQLHMNCMEAKPASCSGSTQEATLKLLLPVE